MLNEDEKLSDLITNINFPVANYSLDTLLKNIIDGTFSTEKVKSLIRFDIDDFLNYDKFEQPESRKQMQELWTNKFFLNCFLKCLIEDNGFVDIMSGYKKEINVIIFDYVFAENDMTKDSEVRDLFIQIAKAVNIKDIIPLLTIMNPDLAWQIAVCRYSSLSETKCVQKLNDAIIFSGADFSIEDIIYIYSRFYPENFKDLFKVTITQTFDVGSLTDLQMKLNDRISWAILYILNSMTSMDIYRVLTEYDSYYESCNSCGIEIHVRFRLRTLSEEFSRIKAVLDAIGGIIP